ncbi:MAG TPA: hypothetical protein VGG88_08945 [Gaiellaceae bacterium]
MIAPDRSFPNGSPVCDYWLARCEGFTVRAGHRTLGVVEKVAHDGSHADAIRLRKRHRRGRTLSTVDVLAVVPARRVLLMRRHQHAVPAMKRAYATAKPLALTVAAALVGFIEWLVATVRREVPRLVAFLLAEIHDRNLHHGEEPSVARTHRRANDYDYGLNTRSNQQPLGRGRNVGPTSRPSARASAASRAR